MKRLLIGVLALTMAGSSMALAQPMGGDRHDQGDHRGDNNNGGRHGDNNGQHRGWGRDYGNGHNYRRGQRMGYNDWQSAERVDDYRGHHLRAPPRGYEWRRNSNGQYILAAVATGVILSIILGNR